METPQRFICCICQIFFWATATYKSTKYEIAINSNAAIKFHMELDLFELKYYQSMKPKFSHFSECCSDVQLCWCAFRYLFFLCEKSICAFCILCSSNSFFGHLLLLQILCRLCCTHYSTYIHLFQTFLCLYVNWTRISSKLMHVHRIFHRDEHLARIYLFHISCTNKSLQVQNTINILLAQEKNQAIETQQVWQLTNVRFE